MTPPDSEPQPQRQSHSSPRRKRYLGTHPRRFSERYKELDAERFPDIQQVVIARGNTPAGSHLPVMAAEVLEVLHLHPGEVVADCTLGHGGHALEILARILPGGLLIGIDRDAQEMARTRELLAARIESGLERCRLHPASFAGLPKLMTAEGVESFDAVFADLGASSMQIDDPARGFSYKHVGPLDMRMDRRQSRTAADWLGKLTEEELTDLLIEWGDEPDAQRVAQEVSLRVARGKMRTTRDLTAAVFAAKGIRPESWNLRTHTAATHPAARTFQALRMRVNDEWQQLREWLRCVPFCLRTGGRVAALTFHGGEDRLVETAFRDGLRSGIYSRTGDPLRPTREEARRNPRSGSARLRCATRA